MVCITIFAWWIHVRPAGALSVAPSDSPHRRNDPTPSEHEILEINGVKFEVHTGKRSRGVQQTVNEFHQQCTKQHGRGVPAHDEHHGFVLCRYGEQSGTRFKLRFVYVRGNDHASTFTELWNTEPLSLQDLAAPHAVAGVEADPNHKLSASNGTINLALHASTLDVAQLVKHHQRELKNLGWDVDVVALSDKQVVLNAKHGTHNKALVISDHPHWKSAIATVEQKAGTFEQY